MADGHLNDHSQFQAHFLFLRYRFSVFMATFFKTHINFQEEEQTTSKNCMKPPNPPPLWPTIPSVILQKQKYKIAKTLLQRITIGPFIFWLKHRGKKRRREVWCVLSSILNFKCCPNFKDEHVLNLRIFWTKQ